MQAVSRRMHEQIRAFAPELAGYAEYALSAEGKQLRPALVGLAASATGKKVDIKIKKIAGGSPIPNQRMANGIQARGERFRKKFTDGSSASRARA